MSAPTTMDLAEAATDLVKVCDRIENGELVIDVSMAARIARARARVERHRCAPPAPEIVQPPPAGPRRFTLQRDQDITGMSGTGQVAEGVEFTDGWVALRWTGCDRVSTVLWPSIADVEVIHGHGGATRIVWLDEVAA